MPLGQTLQLSFLKMNIEVHFFPSPVIYFTLQATALINYTLVGSIIPHHPHNYAMIGGPQLSLVLLCLAQFNFFCPEFLLFQPFSDAIASAPSPVSGLAHLYFITCSIPLLLLCLCHIGPSTVLTGAPQSGLLLLEMIQPSLPPALFGTPPLDLVLLHHHHCSSGQIGGPQLHSMLHTLYLGLFHQNGHSTTLICTSQSQSVLLSLDWYYYISYYISPSPCLNSSFLHKHCRSRAPQFLVVFSLFHAIMSHFFSNPISNCC